LNLVETEIKIVYAGISKWQVYAAKLVARKIELEHIYVLNLATPYPLRYRSTNLVARKVKIAYQNIP